MPLSECLKRIVEERLLVWPERSGKVWLEEEGVMRLQLSGLVSNSIILRIEKIGVSGTREGDWNKSCDYMIVTPQGDEAHVLFIELKKTMETQKIRAFKQLRWSLPRLDYLRSICRVEHGKSPERVVVKYALVSKIRGRRFDKQPTRPGLVREVESYEDIAVQCLVVGEQAHYSRLWGE